MSETNTNTAIVVQELNDEQLMQLAQSTLYRLFTALENATGNTYVAVDVLIKISEGIESDPEFSRSILTPDNIAKIYALKEKSAKGTIKVSDVENAFPALIKLIPMWGLIRNYIK